MRRDNEASDRRQRSRWASSDRKRTAGSPEPREEGRRAWPGGRGREVDRRRTRTDHLGRRTAAADVAMFVVELKARTVDAVRHLEEAGALMRRPVTVDEPRRATDDKARGEYQAVMLPRIEKVVRVEDRTLRGCGGGEEQEEEAAQRRAGH